MRIFRSDDRKVINSNSYLVTSLGKVKLFYLLAQQHNNKRIPNLCKAWTLNLKVYGQAEDGSVL